eukprot:CAMPEP_0198239238 /NCGR_PEP_ID=MMETSP1446-20131203/4699_1 /TAXON_ID=1461542 ORGANISM="Unidentified sp, Strain CCMP2111" /NCGR_SAMPLE_ID=MMETSP1446 /ASSEMBLY_ACC=CAM_ASM_001112 /LENGTH=483 /DNA_ID=CAMNT_0043921793 /DNA_START=45 /DNA_END=1496 /DNA_ORIENTATION=+
MGDAAADAEMAKRVAKGVAIAVGACAGAWLCSELWDRTVQKFARSTWTREHMRYRPGTMSAYFAKVLKKHSDKRRKRRPLRIYVDGCFDMMHYGHFNALRQAKAYGDYLIVGVCSDRDIMANKGPPVFNETERYKMVECVKWVDEIIPNCPYEITEEFMKKLFTKYKVDYIVHGDDPCYLPDGRDAYELAKKAGRYRQVKRTEGVSSTDIVGRMLLCNSNNKRSVPKHRVSQKSMERIEYEFSEMNGTNESDGTDSEDDESGGSYDGDSSPYEGSEDGSDPESLTAASRSTCMSQFLPTSRRIIQFSDATSKGVSKDAKVIYIDGAFDCFHIGHVEALKAAKALGDYLIVGLHSDDIVSKQRGRQYPFMSLHERCLGVLACKYVDEIVMGAPPAITQDLITVFNISCVVHGSVHHGSAVSEDQYKVAKDLGIFKEIQSPSTLSTKGIIERILTNKDKFEAKYMKKSKSEADYFKNREYVHEES